MECFHASVLFPDGWQVVRHRAKRCYNKTCTWHKNRVFYNFVAMSKTRHDFFWHPESGVLSYFFVCCSWGVTTSWLRQMSRRLVRLGAVIKFALGTSDVSTCFQKSPLSRIVIIHGFQDSHSSRSGAVLSMNDCSKPVAGPLLDEVAVAYELCLKPTGQVLADTASAWVRPRIALSVKSTSTGKTKRNLDS